MASSSAPGSETPALAAGIGCYVLWGLLPLQFQVLDRLGVSPWEILAERIVWATPVAWLFVVLARQGRETRAVLNDPRVIGWLTASSLLIALNWATYIWAVNSGRVLETSLGYYLNPLLNMAAGALIFRERLDRTGLAAIALAAVGVAIQAVALGHLPVISLVVAITFCGYGIVRKRVAASAQTGLFVECLILLAPSLAYAAWLAHTGGGHLGTSTASTLWLLACGPATAIPLALFAWAARRVPFSLMGFLQFIAPTMTFVMGVWQGEAFTPARAVSFACIWGGATIYMWGAWKRSRAASDPLISA